MELMDEFYLSDTVGLKRKDLLGSDSLYELGLEFELSKEDVRDYYSHENYKKVLVVVEDSAQYEALDELVAEINPNTDVDWDVNVSGAIAKISKALYSSIAKKPYDVVISTSQDLMKYCKELDPKIDYLLVSSQSLEKLVHLDENDEDYKSHLSDYDLFSKRLNKSLMGKLKH